MSGLFWPECNVPTYLQSDIGVVKGCAKKEGYLMAGIISVMFIPAVWVFVYLHYKDAGIYCTPPNDPECVKKKRRNIIILGVVVTIALLLLLWVILPNFGSWMQMNSYKSYQIQSSQMEKQGLSHQQALKMLQKQSMANQQSAAIANAALLVADSNRN